MANIFLNYIRLGIKATITFNYDGIPITLRPLSSCELDDAESQGYQFVDPNVARLIMMIRLRNMNFKDTLGKMASEVFINIDKYYKEIDFWITYYAMKDFQPEDFTIEDVRKMRYVHDIAMQVLDISSASDKMVMQTINTKEGQELANIIFNFKVPLTDEAWKLTPLQYKFYDLTLSGPKVLASSEEELDKELYGFSVKEALEKIVKH